MIGPRRPGDVVAIYANNDLARNELGGFPNIPWMKCWQPPGDGNRKLKWMSLFIIVNFRN